MAVPRRRAPEPRWAGSRRPDARAAPRGRWRPQTACGAGDGARVRGDAHRPARRRPQCVALDVVERAPAGVRVLRRRPQRRETQVAQDALHLRVRAQRRRAARTRPGPGTAGPRLGTGPCGLGPASTRWRAPGRAATSPGAGRTARVQDATTRRRPAGGTRAGTRARRPAAARPPRDPARRAAAVRRIGREQHPRARVAQRRQRIADDVPTARDAHGDPVGRVGDQRRALHRGLRGRAVSWHAGRGARSAPHEAGGEARDGGATAHQPHPGCTGTRRLTRSTTPPGRDCGGRARVRRSSREHGSPHRRSARGPQRIAFVCPAASAAASARMTMFSVRARQVERSAVAPGR